MSNTDIRVEIVKTLLNHYDAPGVGNAVVMYEWFVEAADVFESLLKHFNLVKSSPSYVSHRQCLNMLVYSAFLLTNNIRAPRNSEGLVTSPDVKKTTAPVPPHTSLVSASQTLSRYYEQAEAVLFEVTRLFEGAPLSWAHIRFLISLLPSPALWAIFSSLSHNAQEGKPTGSYEDFGRIRSGAGAVALVDEYHIRRLSTSWAQQQFMSGEQSLVFRRMAHLTTNEDLNYDLTKMCLTTCATYPVLNHDGLHEYMHTHALAHLLTIYGNAENLLKPHLENGITWEALATMSYRFPRHVFWVVSLWAGEQALENLDKLDASLLRYRWGQRESALWQLLR